MTSSADLPPGPALAFQRGLSAWNARALAAAREDAGTAPASDGPAGHIPSHPWPTFVATATVEKWAALSLALRQLVATAGMALVGRDPERIAALFGYSGARAALVSRVLSLCKPDELFASRADFLLTPGGLRCCELDFGDVGLWHVMAFNATFPHTALAAHLVARHDVPVRRRNPMQGMTGELLKLVGRTGQARECNLAILVPDDTDSALFEADLLETEQASALYAAGLRSYGCAGRILLARAGALVAHADHATVGGDRIQAVMTQTQTLAEEDDIWTRMSLLRLVERDAIAALNGPHCYALSNKIVIALLSEAADDGVIGAAETALVRSAFPWTRRVKPAKTDFRSASHWLPDLLLQHKDVFVLKPSEGYASRGVEIGSLASHADWERAVTLALAQGTWVAQEAVGGLPMWFPDANGALAPHGVNLGVVGCGTAYAGAFLRIKPLADPGEVQVIGYGHGALTAGILEVRDD